MTFPVVVEASLLDGFSQRELESLESSSSHRRLTPGEVLVHQGQTNDTVFVIEAGTLVVSRKDSEGETVELARLGPGEVVGDMSVLRGSRTTATVAADGPGQVWCLRMQTLHETPATHQRLRGNLAIAIVNRLDEATSNIVVRHTREMAARDTQLSAARFIVANFVCLSFYILALPMADYLMGVLPVETLVSLIFIVTFSAVAIRFLRAEGKRFSQYGISLKQWPRQVGTGLAWAVPPMVLLLVAKWAVLQVNASEAPLLVFYRNASGGLPSPLLVSTLCVVYFCFSFAQETVRCSVQKALEIYDGRGTRRAVVQAALVSSLIFASTHAHLGLVAAAGAGIMGLYWSWLYHRSGSFLAVASNHGTIGCSAIFIMGPPF